MHDDIIKELESLKQSFSKSDREVYLPKYVGKNHLNCRPVWEVITSDGNSYYMTSNHSASYIIQADADKFYYHWLSGHLKPYPSHCVLREQMPLDRKFRYAVEGFSEGKDNPVPSAIVHGYKTMTPIAFTDGVTRSFFLLSKGVKSFPVSTHTSADADVLNNLFGLTRKPFQEHDFV